MMQIVSLSKQISLDKKGYYHTLEEAGKGGLDITAWLSWFLNTFANSLHESNWIVDRILDKVRDKNLQCLNNYLCHITFWLVTC